MEKKKFRVAVIGCGRISVRHFESIEMLEDCELVACADIKENRAKECAEKYGITPYTDYKEMIEKERPDAVHICLPHYLHVPVSLYAMEKGVNVLSEKPMAIDIESAKKAVDFAKEKGVLYGVIFQSRYNAPSVFVKNALESGKLGKILSARSILTWSRSDDYYLESDWKGTWEYEGGGVVIDQAIHSIDLVNWMIDSKVKKVSCSMANRGHKVVKVEDTAEGFIEYENGVKYAFYCMNNYACDEPIEIKLCCEKGTATLSYTDAVIKYKDGTEEVSNEGKGVKVFKEGKEYWGHGHLAQVRQFYKALSGEEELEISGENALKTHSLIFDIYNEGRKTL